MGCFLCYGYIIGAVAVGFYFLRKYAQGGQFTKDVVRADGKVVIVTGSNTGIGKETALELANRGARVYMACRNFDRCEKTRNEIVKLSGNANVVNMSLDLTSMESVRNFVKEFLKKETSLDVLINNAGVFGLPRTLTKDGHETVFAANHLGHFLLTNLLLDTLKSSAPSRVVIVSSKLHKHGKIVKDDLHGEKEYKTIQAYGNSKLANILFSRELAKRLGNCGVTTYSLHPGVIRTEINRNLPAILNAVSPALYFLFGKTCKSGAQTTLACALDPDLSDVTGKYFSDCKMVDESEDARDDEMAEWLWRTSEKLTGLAN